MRTIISLNHKWVFRKGVSTPPAALPRDWDFVNLPHTWNGIDGQDGGADFWRGTACYAKELAKTIDIYYSDTDEPRKLRRQEDKIDDVPWNFVMRVPMEKAEGWQDIEFPEPVKAKYLRFELVENWGDETTPPWTETSEIKIYP